MTRPLSIGIAGLIACLSAATGQAHELWFQPAAKDAAVVRLTFGDSPPPGEAERVAEIAHAKVWGDGVPLEVRRLADGLEARLPTPRPTVLSAYADRGIVDYQGDSFVITLAAYAQSRPVKPYDALKLGFGDDQLRLLLVAGDSGRPVVRAVWKGKPAVDAAVTVFRGGETTQARTGSRGELPCPDLSKGPVSLLAVVVDQTPGKRNGRNYSHIRHKATLALATEAGHASAGSSSAECLARVKEIHGAAGPWAVAGYRMGERALRELGLSKHAFTLEVVHRCPAQVQYSCVADGLQAATGASPGKLNLRVEEAAAGAMKTFIRDKKSGRLLTFTLKPEFVRSVVNLPHERLEAEGRRVAGLADDEVFSIAD
ncbi:MAG: formylmethanofuran dehydrogenase subunit E family protein [Isosphaeraceae bacterium]|nr:formylmethanofuran dehydrogenase subunit E family protein [Isosphaeraceae bacterium]